jgi:Tfp pilus assembly PilM family ATPase
LARYLALDWDHNQLQVVEANVGSGGVRVLRAAAWQVTQNPSSAPADALGKSLAERLKTARIGAAPVLVTVGRDRLIIKEVRFPPVADADEPAIVRFQVIKELTEAPESVIIDYVKNEEASTPRETVVQVVILKRDLYDAYQAICKAAGLKVAAVAPRPFGTLAAFRQVAGTSVLTPAPEPANATVALVTVSERQAELCITRGDTLVLTSSLAALQIAW